MKDLKTKDLIQLIIDLSSELEVTAYEFGKNTDISIMGANNILTGTSTNPRRKTLYKMMEYLKSKPADLRYNQTNEKENEVNKAHSKLTNEDKLVDKIAHRIQPCLDKIKLQDAVLAKILLELSIIKDKITS